MEKRSERELALVELEAHVRALLVCRAPRVVVRPEGRTVSEWDVEFPPDPEARARKLAYLLARLGRMTTWADVYGQGDEMARVERILRWPEPAGLPFPEGVPEGRPEERTVPVRVLGARVGESVPAEALEETEPPALPPLIVLPRPHSRYDPATASHVLLLFAAEDAPPMTGPEIAAGLSLANRSVGRAKLAHTLSELVKLDYLTNNITGGGGYQITKEGRRKLDDLIAEQGEQ